MKVCMIVGTDMSHDARVWKEATTLSRRGHQVTVLAAHNPSLSDDESQDGVRVIRVVPGAITATQAVDNASGPATQSSARQSPGTNRRVWFRGIRSLLWWLRVTLQIVRWARHLGPDVIHIHDADRLLAGWLSHLATGAPFVYDSHEYFAGLVTSSGVRARLERQWHITLERLFARKARAVITVNKEIGDRLTSRYRLRKVCIIHNFPNLTTAETKDSKLRALLPAEHRERPILLFQGRLTAFRGIEVFIEVVARIPNVAAIIVGSGPQEDQLKSLASKLELGNRLVFVPQVPWRELPLYTCEADLGFCLSQNTCDNNVLALPNKIFEYLMAGVPVVASDFPVLRRYVRDEGVGIVVPPDNLEQISITVRELLADPERLLQMRSKTSHLARQKYNWETQDDVLASLYDEIAGQRCPSIMRRDVTVDQGPTVEMQLR